MPNLIAKATITYPNRASYDAIETPINNFMDNQGGEGILKPKFNTKDTETEVPVVILLKFYDKTRTQISSIKNSISGASSIFPVGTVFDTNSDEQLTVE